MSLAQQQSDAQVTRTGPDACPGALRPHQAADGPVIRLRLPGGRLTSSAARALAVASARHADGSVHLTSRANLQLRGVREIGGEADAVLVQAIQHAGLLPSASHERVRNVLASPGGAGLVDVDPLVAQLDAAICSAPALAALPGRFLVALDDGSGDVVGSGADLVWWALDGGHGALVVAGTDTGLRVPVEDAVPVLVQVAQAFLTRRGRASAWHVGELDGGAEAFRHELSDLLGGGRGERLELPGARTGLPALGPQVRGDGDWAVAALAPLGAVSAAGMCLLAEAADLARGRLVITPWREVVVPGVSADQVGLVLQRVREAGLDTDPGSPWRGVTACVGQPSCAKALSDVRALASRTVLLRGPALAPLHLSGCDRRCGRPVGAHREAVATPLGHEVADVAAARGPGERIRTGLVTVPTQDVPTALTHTDDGEDQ